MLYLLIGVVALRIASGDHGPRGRTGAGPWLLMAVALGLALFGVFSFAVARWRGGAGAERRPGPGGPGSSLRRWSRPGRCRLTPGRGSALASHGCAP
ncbi:DUF1206 domain-containing protein [Streptomyces sp. GMR22]|nr:DUF1206 domain-containing protein [Streptomyces sp. GMR22]